MDGQYFSVESPKLNRFRFGNSLRYQAIKETDYTFFQFLENKIIASSTFFLFPSSPSSNIGRTNLKIRLQTQYRIVQQTFHLQHIGQQMERA